MWAQFVLEIFMNQMNHKHVAHNWHSDMDTSRAILPHLINKKLPDSLILQTKKGRSPRRNAEPGIEPFLHPNKPNLLGFDAGRCIFLTRKMKPAGTSGLGNDQVQPWNVFADLLVEFPTRLNSVP